MTKGEKYILKKKLTQFDYMLSGFCKDIKEVGLSKTGTSAIRDAYFELTEEIEKYLELKD